MNCTNCGAPFDWPNRLERIQMALGAVPHANGCTTREFMDSDGHVHAVSCEPGCLLGTLRKALEG
jgi:hypothetical protein